MKNLYPLPIMIDDDDDDLVQEARMGIAKLRFERAQLLGKWLSRRQVVLSDPCTVRVGDQTFAEPSDVFPSEGLIARVQLALHAGLPCAEQLVDADQISFTPRGNFEAFTTAVTKYKLSFGGRR